MEGDFHFAAFIMTYERPEALKRTISRLLEQSLPPEKILVVDNGSSDRVIDEVGSFQSKKLEYFKVGYNSGPAGASKIGLLKLVEMGYNWIYWCDDDNPPRDEYVLQELFKGIDELDRKGLNIGIFGGKGGRLNKWTGRISSLSNKELGKATYAEVDVVPGGHDMLVSSRVIKAGILPDEKLFFGFEELDFCLKTKAASFKIYIAAEAWLNVRRSSKRDSPEYRWNQRAFGDQKFLSREFYSTRNLLEIFYKRKFYLPFTILFLKSLVKIPAGYLLGRSYGFKMARIQFSAIMAFLGNEFGKKADLNLE